MSQTISKAIGESLAGKGELYAALAYDTSDKFGGYEIKSICLNWASYEDGDGRVCFYDEGMYIAPYTTDELDIVADDAIWLISDDIYVLGNLHFYGDHGEETSTSTIAVILTDPTTAANALYGYVDAGGAWTAGNMVGVRGYVSISGANNFVSATGVWAGLDFTTSTGSGSGLTCALNAEASSNNAVVPNAIVYIQSLPGASANFSDVPYIVFAETRGGATGTGSRYLFEVGHKSAGKIPPIGSDELFYNDTLQICVNETAGNRTNFFIPLSTVTGTFTTEYPIVTTYGTIAIDISSTTTGIDITDASTAGININGTCATGIIIGDGTTTGISITGASGYAIDIQTTGHFRMGTGPAGTEIGIPVTDTVLHNMEVYTEPTVVLSDYRSTFGIRSRYLIDTAQTKIVTFEAVDARMRVKKSLTQGLYAGVQGYIEVDGSPTLNATQIHAGGFTVEIGAGTTLSGGYVCGVHIDSATADSVSVASVTYAALRISTGTSSKEIWTYGILMGDADAVTGIQIGNATTGIKLDGTFTNALSIAATMADPAISDGSAMGCQVEATMTGTATGMFSATSSWANVNGVTGANWVNAVTTGIWENAGSSGDVTDGVLIFGMRMQAVLTATDFDRLCPFALNTTSTVTALFSVGNTNTGGDCGYIEAVTESDAPIGYVPLLVDSGGTVHYVRVYADTD